MNLPQTIAIVGASARAAAFSALRAGYQVVTADLFADAELQLHANASQVTLYPEGLSDWLAHCDCDAWMYTGALENHPNLVDAMAGCCQLLGNSGEVLRQVRSPWQLLEAGLPVPETTESAENLPQDGSWLAKTYRGSCGSGVWEIQDNASYQQAADLGAVFQRKLQGQSVAAVVVFGEGWHRVLGITQQWVGEEITGATDFKYAGSVCRGRTFSTAVQKQIASITQNLSVNFNLRGLVGIDLLLDENDKVWLLEVNPRYTASVEVVERSTGESALAAHVAACTGADEVVWNAQERRTVGKAVLYAKQDLVIDQVFFDWAMQEIGPRLDGNVADIPQVGCEIQIGQPVLTVFAEGDQEQDDQFLRQRVAELEQRLYGKT